MIKNEDIIKLKSYTVDTFDVSELGDYYVLVFEDKKYLKVSSEAKFIIEQIDGKKTFQELLNILNRKKYNLKADELKQFIITKLFANNLIINQKENKKRFTGKLWYHKKICNGSKIESLGTILADLCNKNIAVFSIILSSILFPLILFKNIEFLMIEINIFTLNTVGILVIVFASFFIHELGHIAVTRKYKKSVGDLGVGLYLFRPVMYVDLSDTWTLNRIKRVWVDFGGVYFQLIFNLILMLLYIVFKNETLLISIFLIFISIIGNLNPVLRFDGYWILTDILGIVNIDKRAFEFVKNLLKFRKYSDNLKYSKKIKLIFIFYSLIYVLFSVIAILFGIIMLITLFKNPINLYNQILHPIYLSIINLDLNMLIKNLNSSLMYLFPIIYILMLIINIFGNMNKGASKNA